MSLEQAIERYTQNDESINRENANKNSSLFSCQRDLLAGVVSKTVALEELLPEDVAEGHRKGWIHFHDLDYVLNSSGGMYNCMLVDFPGMLKNGFIMGEAEIEPPKSLRTAGEVIPQIIANVSSNMYGGLSAHRIDEFLEPYALMSYKKNLRKNILRMAEFEGVEMTEEEINTLIETEVSKISVSDNEFMNGEKHA